MRPISAATSFHLAACSTRCLPGGRRSRARRSPTSLLQSSHENRIFRAFPANLHPKMHDVTRRCLAKNRKDRWHAIADVRVELETIMADPFGTQLQAERIVQRQPLWRRAIPIVITAAIVAVLAIAGTLAVINRRA